MGFDIAKIRANMAVDVRRNMFMLSPLAAVRASDADLALALDEIERLTAENERLTSPLNSSDAARYAEIQARLDAVTPGPKGSAVLGGNTGSEPGPAGFLIGFPRVPFDKDSGFVPADAEFLGRAEGDVEWLLAKATSLHGDLNRARVLREDAINLLREAHALAEAVPADPEDKNDRGIQGVRALCAEVRALRTEVGRLRVIVSETEHPDHGRIWVATCTACQTPYPAWTVSASLRCPDCRSKSRLRCDCEVCKAETALDVHEKEEG